jgi:transcription termination factor NusB
MKLTWKSYVIAAIIMAVSFLGAWLLPIPDIFKGAVAVPGGVSLIGALYQMFRDEAAYQKQAELQRQQQIYNLSVTSHMANIAFDKHVEFCEAYINKMNDGIRKLLSEGPKPEALSFAKDLTQLRIKYMPWLTEDIVKKISKYEDQLGKIGFKCGSLDCAKFDDKLRAKLYDEIDNIFSEVVRGTNEDEESMSDKIVTHLQELLGIKELTMLRQNVIKEALKSIK